jgi:dUTP pyrophosphatase
MDIVKLEYKFLQPGAKVPTRSKPNDAGMDIYAVEDTFLPAGKLTSVQTGIAIACPPGYYFTIEGRSGLYMKGIFPTRGIIDAGYNGPLIVALMNTGADYKIEAGHRIAQMILHKLIPVEFSEVAEFSAQYSTRGAAGFGSTGK